MIEMRWLEDERWVGGTIIQTSKDLVLQYRQQVEGEWTEWVTVPMESLLLEVSE